MLEDEGISVALRPPKSLCGVAWYETSSSTDW